MNLGQNVHSESDLIKAPVWLETNFKPDHFFTKIRCMKAANTDELSSKVLKGVLYYT